MGLQLQKDYMCYCKINNINVSSVFYKVFNMMLTTENRISFRTVAPVDAVQVSGQQFQEVVTCLEKYTGRLDPNKLLEICISAYRGDTLFFYRDILKGLPENLWAKLQNLLNPDGTTENSCFGTYPRGFVWVLALTYICLKGDRAFTGDFIPRRLNGGEFKRWLSTYHSMSGFSFAINKISDLDLEQITTYYGDVCFNSVKSTTFSMDANFIVSCKVSSAYNEVGEWHSYE